MSCSSLNSVLNLFAGNLLVLRDGRIGFIDFGIVGRIPPATWLALQSLASAFQDSNFDLMARYKCTGFCPQLAQAQRLSHQACLVKAGPIKFSSIWEEVTRTKLTTRFVRMISSVNAAVQKANLEDITNVCRSLVTVGMTDQDVDIKVGLFSKFKCAALLSLDGSAENESSRNGGFF